MPRRLLAAAAVGALLLGLAACGDGDEGAVTTPPPSISVGAPSDGGGGTDPGPGPSDGGGSETDAPTAAAPDIPPPDPADYAGMDERTPEGAEQAFRYYIAVSMWAHQTGRTDILESHQSPDCGSCAELTREVSLLRQHNDYWSPFAISDVGTQLHTSETFEHEVGYYFTISAHTRPNEDFTGRIEVGPIEYITVGGMLWETDRWIVGGINAEWGDDVHT